MTIKKTYSLPQSTHPESAEKTGHFSEKKQGTTQTNPNLFQDEQEHCCSPNMASNQSTLKNASSMCCQEITSSTASTKTKQETPLKSISKKQESLKNQKTTIHIHYDVGFNNVLFLRGNGLHLSWEKGIPLKNIKHNEWLWESEHPFQSCEFKVLINDHIYEQGENHRIAYGTHLTYTPHF